MRRRLALKTFETTEDANLKLLDCLSRPQTRGGLRRRLYGEGGAPRRTFSTTRAMASLTWDASALHVASEACVAFGTMVSSESVDSLA